MSVPTIERRIIVVLGIEHIINYGIAFLKQTMQSCCSYTKLLPYQLILMDNMRHYDNGHHLCRTIDSMI